MQTISKSLGESLAGKGELYAALAYDATDVFGGMAIKQVRFNPATGVASIVIGDSTTHWSSSTADTKVISIYADITATSGDNRSIYNRLYLKGTGGGGESLRSYTEITGVVVGTAHGAHLSLGMGESTTGGAVTGLGAAVRCTLGLPSVALASGGTYTALMAEIYSFGTSSDAGAVTELSFLRVVNDGHTNGKATVQDDAFFFVLDGFSTDDTGLWKDGAFTATNGSETIKVKTPSGTRYLVLYDAR